MNSGTDPQSVATALRIDSLCDQFEDAWRVGHPLRIEDLLAPLPPSEREAALTALLRVELELRQRAGERPLAADYQLRFTHEAGAVIAVFAELARQPTTDTSVSQAVTRTLSANHDSLAAELADEPQPATIGRFVVLSKLGEGAFGMVYRSRDPQLDRDVAIKVPRAGTLSRPGDVERFLRESKVAATMHHPNICPVYEVGTANGRPFIVMALVPGKSLAEHLAHRPQPFPARQAALIVRKIALALELAHRKGVIHRDLKPANILIDDERKDVVVMDFGLARRETQDAVQLTQSGILMGTPAYMSPEQARGDSTAIGPASDIYSLGVILYELLAGERPFTGSMAEVLGKILHVDPPPPSAVRKEVDSRLEAICMRAMARQPADRFPSMRALADALSGWLKGSTVGESLRESSAAEPLVEPAAKPTTTRAESKPAASPARRWVWPVLTAATLTVGLIAAGTILYLPTSDGTVRVEINDPQIKVVIDKDNSMTFQGIDKKHEITLKPGPHGLTITRGDFTFDTTKFELKKGRATILEVELLAGNIRVSQDGKSIAGAPLATKQSDGEPFNPRTTTTSGWKQLFNGNDLTGWQVARGPGDTTKWDVRDGILTGTGQGEWGFLYTERSDFRDFHLRLEARINADGNSGVRLHVPTDSLATEIGLEAQISVAEDQSTKTGEIYGRPGNAGPVHHAADEWFTMDVIVRDGRLKTRVNGEETGDMPLNSTGDAPTGHIGLQRWGPMATIIEFRKIEIQEFPAGPAHVDRAVAQWAIGAGGDGEVLLGDGRTVSFNSKTPLPAESFRISSLRFTYNAEKPASSQDLTQFAQLENLQSLILERFPMFPIADDWGAEIGKLSRLRTLIIRQDVRQAPITHKGLAPLRNLKQLKILALTGIDLDQEGLAHIVALSELDHLALERCNLSDQGIRKVAEAPKLRTLELQHIVVSAAELAALRDANPTLNIIRDEEADPADLAAAAWVLSVKGSVKVAVGGQVTKWIAPGGELPAAPFQLHSVFTGDDATVQDLSELRILSGLTGLQHLNLEHHLPYSDATMEVIGTLTGLEKLRFEDPNAITDAGLRRLSALVNLRELNLVSPLMTDAPLEVISHLPKLEKLDLAVTGYDSKPGGSAPLVTEHGLARLKGATQLKQLNVYGVPVNAEGLRAIGTLQQVRTLKVGGSLVTDEGLQGLAGMAELESLFLIDSTVTDAGLVHLQGLKKLAALDLGVSPIDGTGAEHLQPLKMLRHFSSRSTTDAGLEKIKLLQALAVLDIRGSKVTDAGIPHLTAMADHLKVLHLIDTAVSDASVPHLAKLTMLHGLTLNGTKVTDAGIAKLKQALPNCNVTK